MKRLSKLVSLAPVVLFYLLLLAPILVVAPVSLSREATLGLPTAGLSLRWYQALGSDPRIVHGFLTSLRLGAIVTVVSLALGLPAAIAIARLPVRVGAGLLSVFTLPLMLPAVILGLGLLLVLVQLGLLATFPGLVLAHLVVVVPYVIRILASAAQTLTAGLEEAAATLGAGPLAVFATVTLPLLARPLASAAALAFLTSFDEAVVSLFLTGADISTLPVVMFEYAKSRADPTIAALSVVLLMGAFVLIVVVDRIVGLSRVAK